MKIGERIKVLLKFKKMSQKDLAKKVKASEALVSRWCKNVLQPKLKHATKIADCFGITLDMLVGNCLLFDELLADVDCRLL